MRNLLEATTQRAIAYLEGLESRKAAPDAEALAGLARFDEPLPMGQRRFFRHYLRESEGGI